MRHCDDETLAALALGEPVDAPDATHVESCEECARELSALRATAASLVDAGASGPLVAPPASVWDGIAAEVASEAEPRPAPVVPLTAARGARRRREPGHMFRPWVVGAAAAAGVVIGAFGISLLTRDTVPEQTLVAQAALSDLASEADAGTARVEQRSDGTEVLVVDTTVPSDPDGALEVWLIDPDVVGMVSLGFLTGDHGEFEIPAGYDVVSFPIVDISVEPADGDPTHSGDSITRGILES
ncbi:anti-sigma factor domain-containing protein [Demequina lignilytica]|uniref:Anti-sigma factor n=1 Tax=Demequina lignilytica TaxID=3051663 RepID=A0AB35MGK8_9MICO|nr:anti-sigma factor [Demequina sp. SYSU T0a273]MDN4482915.1 anti-sigma factor [Demequina sp. SYSU T0a273]